MKRDNMLNHLAHTLPHWPTEYTDMIEPGYGWAWYDEGEDCTLVLCKGEEEIREADYAARRAELSAAKGWDESRADAIGQNGNDGQHYPDTKTWWTQKPCTLCKRQTAAKVSDDRPVCHECVAQDSDPVNHPAHYTNGAIECIDALEAATVNKRGIEAVCTANAIKYLWRYESKGGAEDVRKARWYIDRLLAALEAGQ